MGGSRGERHNGGVKRGETEWEGSFDDQKLLIANNFC